MEGRLCAEALEGKHGQVPLVALFCKIIVIRQQQVAKNH